MSRAVSLGTVLLATCAVAAQAQTIEPKQWRAPGSTAQRASYVAEVASGSAESAPAAPRAPIAKVTEGGGLPNDSGQVWREYDITPFISRASWTGRPEQTIVDWILRETGYEAWHGEPVGVLTANRQSLKAYHTSGTQQVVGEVVDRFVNPAAADQAFGMRVVTIESPNWRAGAVRLLEPLPIETPGAQAWLMAKEDAALLVAELRRRLDFREHSSPQMLVAHGQQGSVAVTRPRTYMRNVHMRPDVYPGYQVEPGQLAEGFSLDLLPLLSVDGRIVDAVLRFRVDQVERLVPVPLEIPTPTNPRQRVRVDVPQLSQVRVDERFRWPVERVLLVALGVVPTPTGSDNNPLMRGISMSAGPGRADMLIFVECKGRSSGQTAQQAPRTGGDNYRGRY